MVCPRALLLPTHHASGICMEIKMWTDKMYRRNKTRRNCWNIKLWNEDLRKLQEG
jgi:hypothetical protein